MRERQKNPDEEGMTSRVRTMESIGTHAAGIAHDFNNLLVAIVGYAELSLESIADRPVVQEHLLNLLYAAEQGKALVARILTFSRSEASSLRPMSPLPAVREAIRFVKLSLPETVAMREHLRPNAPEVLGDATQIQQVVMNLALNAAAAMPGGGDLDISLEPVRVADELATTHPDLHPGLYARLTIADNGTGMPTEVLERAFDPCFSTRQRGKGTGLGLFVVRGIVKDHGGAIIIESEPGNGTTAHVYLPATK